MIEDVFVVDASAHSYNLAEENYAAGRYSKAVVDAFYGAHYVLSAAGYRIPYEHYTRDWTLEETANMLFVESDYDFACHHVTPINAFKDGGCSIQKAKEARDRWPGRFQVYAGVDPVFPEQALDSLALRWSPGFAYQQVGRNVEGRCRAGFQWNGVGMT